MYDAAAIGSVADVTAIRPGCGRTRPPCGSRARDHLRRPGRAGQRLRQRPHCGRDPAGERSPAWPGTTTPSTPCGWAREGAGLPGAGQLAPGPPEIAFILKDAGARLLVCGEDFVDVVDMIVSDCPDLHHLVQFEPGHPRWPSFDDWIGQHSSQDPNLPVRADDDVIQLYTSGTTGLPRRAADPRQLPGPVRRRGGPWRLGLFRGRQERAPGHAQFHVAGCNMGMFCLLQGPAR